MNFKFIYSQTSEYQIVNDTLADRYLIERYNYKVWLPKNIDWESNSATIKAAIKTEMSRPKINRIKQDLQKELQTHKTRLKKFIKKWPANDAQTYEVYLSQYGVGGSYHLPNKVIINVNYGQNEYFTTLIHELLHLLVEPTVVKKNLNHAQKEGLVDYLMINSPPIKQMIPRFQYQSISKKPTRKQSFELLQG